MLIILEHLQKFRSISVGKVNKYWNAFELGFKFFWSKFYWIYVYACLSLELVKGRGKVRGETGEWASLVIIWTSWTFTAQRKQMPASGTHSCVFLLPYFIYSFTNLFLHGATWRLKWRSPPPASSPGPLPRVARMKNAQDLLAPEEFRKGPNFERQRDPENLEKWPRLSLHGRREGKLSPTQTAN